MRHKLSLSLILAFCFFFPSFPITQAGRGVSPIPPIYVDKTESELEKCQSELTQISNRLRVLEDERNKLASDLEATNREKKQLEQELVNKSIETEDLRKELEETTRPPEIQQRRNVITFPIIIWAILIIITLLLLALYLRDLRRRKKI